MSLNIKDPEAHRLARDIAEATGDSMTHVVIEALRWRHRQLQRREKASVAELLAIADRVAARLERPYPDHAELLYGDDGLPE